MECLCSRSILALLGPRRAESGEPKVGGLLAKVYNELLEQAKKGFPEDQLVDTLTPVGEALHPRVLQALTGQLTLVLGGFGK